MKQFKKLLTLMSTLALMTFVLAGCGGVNSTTDAQNNTEANNTNNVADDLGNAAEDVGDAVGDVAQDAGNAVGDLIDGSNGFDNYEDAHDYFMQQMGMNDTNANYEVRNAKKDLVSYDNENQGYQFELYDTANNKEGERKGIYYVDAKTGKIYLKDEANNKVTEVTINNATNTTNNTNTTNGTENTTTTTK